MNEKTLILAALVIVAHCIAIFWPRRPLAERTDAEGAPVVWHNQDDGSRDVACVWPSSSREIRTSHLASSSARSAGFQSSMFNL